MPRGVVIAAWLLTTTALAQRVEVHLEPRELTLDDVAALQVFLREPSSRILPPEVDSDDFTVEAIPPAEGRFTREGILWRFLLVPIRNGEGRVRIALTAGGRRFEREEILRVHDDSVSSLREPSSQDAVTEDLTGRRFVRAEVDKQRVYVHEQVTYRFRYYFENFLPSSTAPQYALPVFRGFLSKPLDPSSKPLGEKVRLGNREYYVEEVRVALFPLTPGTWEIPPTRLVLPSLGRRGSRELKTESLRVTALPLPTPPPGFSGGVGQFTIHLETPDSEGQVSASVRIRVVIEGRGNLQTLTNVPLPEVSGARLFEPTLTETAEIAGGLVGGNRTYEYILTPERSGTLIVRMPPLITFDPLRAEYVASEVKELRLPVREVTLPKEENEARPAASWERRFWKTVRILFLSVGIGVAWTLGRHRFRRRRKKSFSSPFPSIHDIPLGDGRVFCRALGEVLRSYLRRYRETSSEANEIRALLQECELGEFSGASFSLPEQEALRERALRTLEKLCRSAKENV